MTADKRLTTAAAVRTTLKAVTSTYAELFRELIDSHKIGPWNTKSTIVRKRFGPEEADYPYLSKRSPFTKLPTIAELRDMLLVDVEKIEAGEEPPLMCFPPQDDAQADCAVVRDFITNLTKSSPTLDARRSRTTKVSLKQAIAFDRHVIEFTSRTLDAIVQESKQESKEEVGNGIFATRTTCTLFDASHIIELQHHNESRACMTLMTGTIVWVIWPPTDANLNTLQVAYEAFADSGSNKENLDVARDLEGGVTFVQQAGEMLRLPPFCPVMGLTTAPSVLAKYADVTVDSFLSMCHKIPFYKSWWKTEINPEQKQEAFANALQDCITLILEGDLDHADKDSMKYPITEEGPMLSVLRAWHDIKDDVVGVMDTDTKRAMKEAWIKFMGNAKTQVCLICGMRCRNGDGLQSKQKAHFEERHWVSETVEENVGEPMELV